MDLSNIKMTILAMLLLAISASAVMAQQPTDTNDDPPEKRNLPSGSSSNYQMLINTIKAVLFVAVFGTAAIFITKKLAPRITNQTGKSIRILENVSLGQRRSLHLIEIQGRKILLGSNVESIVKLCEFKAEAQTDPENCEDQND